VRFGRDETGRWKTTPDRHEDIGRMNISRPLIWAFRVALVLLWLSRAPAPSGSWSGSSPPPGHPRCWHWPRGPARRLASGVLPRGDDAKRLGDYDAGARAFVPSRASRRAPPTPQKNPAARDRCDRAQVPPSMPTPTKVMEPDSLAFEADRLCAPRCTC
jgi:hypothetical protein